MISLPKILSLKPQFGIPKSSLIKACQCPNVDTCQHEGGTGRYLDHLKQRRYVSHFDFKHPQLHVPTVSRVNPFHSSGERPKNLLFTF